MCASLRPSASASASASRDVGLAHPPLRAAADAATLHYRRAARMYRYAPINAAARHDSRVRVGAGTAVATAPVKEEFCHTAGGLHGSGYFKLLDDAAFFAAQSLNPTHFVVTTSSRRTSQRWLCRRRCQRLRPADDLVHQGLILAEAVLRTPDGTEVARGSGTFMPHPKLELALVPPYVDDDKFPFIEEDDPL